MGRSINWENNLIVSKRDIWCRKRIKTTEDMLIIIISGFAILCYILSLSDKTIKLIFCSIISLKMSLKK